MLRQPESSRPHSAFMPTPSIIMRLLYLYGRNLTCHTEGGGCRRGTKGQRQSSLALEVEVVTLLRKRTQHYLLWK